MKKIIALVIAFVLLLGLVACGGEQTQNGSGNGKFVVGYGEVDITPTSEVHLGSFQNAMERVSTGVRNEFYAKTLAFTDADGNTLLIIITDLSWGHTNQLSWLRAKIPQLYDIPAENILLGGTHNHNGPEWMGEGYNQAKNQTYFNSIFFPGVLQSVKLALEDRSEAQMMIGADKTEGLTFVRRYIREDGNLTGSGHQDSYVPSDSPIDHYESEGDEEAQFLKIVREGKKDVLLAQWQCHANLYGNTTIAGTDWVGPMRDKMEEELNCHVIYMNGAAGNMNPNTKGKFTADYPNVNSCDDKGEMIADAFIEMVTSDGFFTNVASGKVQVKQVIYIGKQYSTSAAWEGEMNSVVIGDLGLVTMPVEMFAESGVAIKEGSPCDMTLIMGYTNGICSYAPTRIAVENGGYEVIGGRAQEDTAEKMVEIYINGLKELHG